MIFLGKVLVCGLTAAGVGTFLYLWFLPYIKTKWTLWMSCWQIRRMAKRYPGETGDKLKQIADGLANLAKDEKLFDDEDEEK
jgi:CHASE2 domain-containing sensor protein